MGHAEELFEDITANGEEAIRKLIADFQSENLWLDFKQARDGGIGARLHVDDRQNLAKAISGFGNSDGGVIVWGVDCRRDAKTGADLPGPATPLPRPHVFRSWLENAIASSTTPPHRGVRHEVVTQQGLQSGFVVSLVPFSDNAPHQAVQPTNDLRYYMRVGSTFATIPHAVLAGMFGRRPQPRVDQFWFKPSLSTSPKPFLSMGGTIAIRNTGRSMARDIYLSVEGGDFMFGTHSENLFAEHRVGQTVHFISHEHIRLPPGATFLVADMSLMITERVPSYTARLSCGCDGAEPRTWSVRISAPELSTLRDTATTLAAANESLLGLFARFLPDTGA